MAAPRRRRRRVYNERLVVSLVRRHGQLSKVDLTRLTGLAAPDHHHHRQPRRRPTGSCCVGSPCAAGLGSLRYPTALNPAAAYAFGLKVDHRSADVALIDFVGNVLAFEQTTVRLSDARRRHDVRQGRGRAHPAAGTSRCRATASRA